MREIINTSTIEISYEKFVCYFENYYLNELSSHRIYEKRLVFLENIKRLACEHKRLFELKHGGGAYNINFGKYGKLQRTPLQIIEGDLNCTHLLMPKISHNYITHFGYNNYSRISWSRIASAM